ncbi:MAG TPA: DUF763 domain-containing protein [Polyangiaceae bacterium]|jgi:hypothetical protein|nr:DUF763 domain-containing protein [Polyangiaceae bacterium]
MASRTGRADLPLHGGHVPAWLATRMERLGRVIAEAIVLEYGTDELLRRLAHPFWFQSFGAVMGMDWHSSGITTSVLGALKRGLAPVADELGIYVCGGRGRHSRKTPEELRRVGDATGIDGEALARASRLVAKVDGAAVQDGFELYLHGFVVTRSGAWTVVQQGMRTETRTARRYHWLSEGLKSFVDAPHAAIDGEPQGDIVNLADRRAARAREVGVELVRAGPAGVLRELAALERTRPATDPLPHLFLPGHHEVTSADVVGRRVAGALAAAHERMPVDFAELLLVPGVGARTVFALAQVAEVLHGAPSRFSDPARFSLAHGGKDGHPYPVPLAVYDRTLGVLRRAVDRAMLGESDKLGALQRLDEASRRLEEQAAPTYDFDTHVREERARSREWEGRSVGDRPSPPRRPKPKPAPGQLRLRLR